MDPYSAVLMIGTSLVQGGLSYLGASRKAAALREQAAYSREMTEVNRQLAEVNAQDAIRRGDRAASQVYRNARKTMGAQRVAAAVQGIDVNSGSAAELQGETQFLSELDMLTAKNNAWREAWGYRVQSNEATRRGTLSTLANYQEANNTLLTGGLNFINSGIQGFSYLAGSRRSKGGV